MAPSATDVAYAADGTTMVGRLVVPDGEGRRPAVLVVPEGIGLDEFQRSRPERFAEELGYVAFAVDYFGGGVPITDRDARHERLIRLGDEPAVAREIMLAALGALLAEPTVDASRVVAVGYCAGGALALELARTGADLKAVVAFHGGLDDRRDDSAAIRGPVLMCVGADDPMFPPAVRLGFEEEMRAAGVDYRINLYGGARHSFTNPLVSRARSDALAYDERTDRRSWRAMVDLFDEVL